MKGLVSIILLVLSAACVSGKPSKLGHRVATPVRFKDCGSKLAKVVNVTITPCDISPCFLYKGKNSTVTMSFTMLPTVKDVNYTKADVHAIVLGVKFPYAIPNTDGCSGCGLSCPLQASTTYTYSFTLFISPSFPSVDCVVEWELKQTTKDRKTDSDDVFCIEIPVKVK